MGELPDDGSVSLEEMAGAIEAQREELRAARAHREELRGPYTVAVNAVNATMDRLKAMEQAMEGVVRAHMLRQALEAAGVEYDGPPLVAVRMYFSNESARMYYLVAVGPGGTGLYRFTPDRARRFEAKQHAIRVTDVRGEDVPRRICGKDDSDLCEWEERGTGEWGPRSGSMKPKAPPEGGRWKWLKVREQETLSAGGA